MFGKYQEEMTHGYTQLLEKGIKVLLSLMFIDYSDVDFQSMDSVKTFLNNNHLALNIQNHIETLRLCNKEGQQLLSSDMLRSQTITLSQINENLDLNQKESFDIITSYNVYNGKHKIQWRLKFHGFEVEDD